MSKEVKQALEREITTKLNQEQALEIFDREKVFYFDKNGIPKYRVIELFGEQVARWIDKNTMWQGYLKGGIDYNGCGMSEDNPQFIEYFLLPGYLKIVTQHNYQITVEQENKSQAKPIIEQLNQARLKRIDG